MSIKISLSVKIYYSTFIFPPVYIRNFINDRVQQFVNYGAPLKTSVRRFFYAGKLSAFYIFQSPEIKISAGLV